VNCGGYGSFSHVAILPAADTPFAQNAGHIAYFRVCKSDSMNVFSTTWIASTPTMYYKPLKALLSESESHENFRWSEDYKLFGSGAD
jgi:hypothetical protein